ncbi:MAG: TRAP transporter small permease [Desulfobacterales bacterium]
MANIMNRILSNLAKISDYTSILILFVIAIQLITVVVMRYVFYSNSRFLEQSSTILFFYLVFIPAGILAQNNQHLNVELVFEYLTKKGKTLTLRYLKICLRLIETIFCATVAYFALRYTVHLIAVNATFDFEFFGERVPQWATSVSFIVGFFLMTIFNLESLIKLCLRK